MEREILNLEGIGETIAKADGNLNPADVYLNGSLTPEEGAVFIQTIFEKHHLLSKITTDKTSKLTKTRSGWDIAKGQLNRHVPGTNTGAANKKKLEKIGCNLDMTNPVELNAEITEDTLVDNAKNPKFADEQYDKFATVFANDIQYLGFVGKDDNKDATAPFEELAKGWVHIAKTDAKTNKTSTSNSVIMYRLKHLVKNAHNDVKGKASILMSAADYLDYQFEIAEKFQSLATLLSADNKQFMGFPIETSEDMPDGEYLLTPIKNMVLGMATQVIRRRWFDNDESVLKYKFIVYPDYEFDIKKYITFMNVVGLDITSYETSVAVGSDSQKTVTSAAGAGLTGVTAISKNEEVATVAYDSGTGVITITGVAEGTTTVTVDDGTSTKDIAVTVTAA